MRNFASSFTHEQEEASNAWVITHGMGCKPSVSASVDYEGSRQVIIPKDIVYVDDNTVRVEFSQAFTGSARLV